MANNSMPPTPVRNAFAGAQSFANWLDLIRRVTVSLAVIAGIGVVAILVVREVFREGIIIDPVIVQLPDAKSDTKELVAQQIARHIDLIQRAGVDEWRKLYVDQATSPIDLQVPGAPLTLRASIREIAALFGVRQPTLRVSIVIRREPVGYVASIAVVGRPDARSTCEADDKEGSVERLLECIALRAIGLIDPKVAAVHAFKSEERNCNGLDSAQAEADHSIREQQLIESRRGRCSFNETQKLIAKMLERGDADDLPWVSYVFGRIHLARAAAIASIDPDQQLAELDQAIGRFAASRDGMPASPTALTVLIDTHLRKGMSLREMPLAVARDEKLREWRFQLAEWAFADAERELRDLPRRQSQALRVLVHRFEGKLIYLRWMLAVHRRSGLASALVASDPSDVKELRIAADHYAAATANGSPSAALFIEWGNVLHAIGEFDQAAQAFVRAADLSPGDPTPRLNIAIAYLDGVTHKPDLTRPLLQKLIALGASADYLGWSSTEGPPTQLVVRIRQVVADPENPEDARSFSNCEEQGRAALGTPPSPDIERWQAIAALKVCVDQAIDRLNDRNIAAYRAQAGEAKSR